MSYVHMMHIVYIFIFFSALTVQNTLYSVVQSLYSTLSDKNRPQHHFVCFVCWPAVILRQVKEMDLSSKQNFLVSRHKTVCRPEDHFVLDLTLFLPNSPPTPSDTVNQGSQAICIIIVPKWISPLSSAFWEDGLLLFAIFKKNIASMSSPCSSASGGVGGYCLDEG